MLSLAVCQEFAPDIGSPVFAAPEKSKKSLPSVRKIRLADTATAYQPPNGTSRLSAG